MVIVMKDRTSNQIKFNIFSFISIFARSLLEVFISLYLFKNGFSIKSVLTFYLLENGFAFFISYLFVKIGEKYKYSTVMYIGIFSFIVLQIVLNNIVHSYMYIILISFLYSLYRRGYWVSRRYYITDIIPQRNSSESFSILMIVSEIASIISGYFGGFLLDSFNILLLTIISSVLLVISVIPLIKIKTKTSNKKIELIKNLKKYDKRNYVAFSLYEINNLLTFIFPIYIAMYIKDSYIMASSINAISNLAIIVFILVYGRIIKKRNYFVISSALFVFISISKLFFLNYFIFVFYFIEGLIKKMQEQSVNKIYFENRRGMDLTHYNLIYQLTESLVRVVVVLPLLFINDIKMMILFILLFISSELVIYAFFKKSKKLD